MTETTTACIRGCSMYRRHLADCEGSTDETCSGCLPRRADHGLLCWPCHRRLELMLRDAPVVHRWLTANMATGQGAAATDGEHVTGSREQPLPIKVQIFDLRQLMADRLALWVDDVVETQGLTGPTRHTVEADALFIAVWLGTIERMEAIGDWWEELAEGMRDAHALAPWRPTMKRCPGIPCPHCGEVNLVIFGGESDVTCLSCKQMIPEQRYGIWTEALKYDRGVEVAG